MKKTLSLTMLMCLILAFIACSSAEELPLMDVTVSGEFDEPALIHPEERYETFFEKTDGSDTMMFALLDSMNDEAKDIEQYGALYITENVGLNSKGKPSVKLKMAIQDSPYGKVICSEQQFLWMKVNTYSIAPYLFMYDGETVETQDGDDQETHDFYCESYHFPYGRLELMNGVRQDENGYIYFFIQSDENRSFEFVAGEGMRIKQLRIYERDEDGALALTSYVDYDVGPAWEIPQVVLDAMDEVLSPTEQ